MKTAMCIMVGWNKKDVGTNSSYQTKAHPILIKTAKNLLATPTDQVKVKLNLETCLPNAGKYFWTMKAEGAPGTKRLQSQVITPLVMFHGRNKETTVAMKAANWVKQSWGQSEFTINSTQEFQVWLIPIAVMLAANSEADIFLGVSESWVITVSLIPKPPTTTS